MSYIITTPVTFNTVSSKNKEINFNTINRILNFGTNTQGDILIRSPQTLSKNYVTSLPIGTAGQALVISGGVANASHTITSVDDVNSSLDGLYFVFGSDSTIYYVWFTLNANTKDPYYTVYTNYGSCVGVKITLSPGAIAASVATAISTALSSLGATILTSTVASGVLTVKIAQPASVTLFDAGTSGFTGSTIQGSNLYPTWTNIAVPLQLVLKVSNCNAVTTNSVAPVNPNIWVLLDNTIVTWNDSVFPGEDPYGLFSNGSITADQQGIWSLSASALFQPDNSGTALITNYGCTRQLKITLYSISSKTETDVIVSAKQATANASNGTQVQLNTSALQLNVGDVVKMYVKHDAINPLNIMNNVENSSTLFQTFFNCSYHPKTV